MHYLKLFVLFSLSAFTTVGFAQDEAAGLPNLASLLGQEEEEFLHPDDAFQFTVTATDGSTVNMFIEIAEGYYLYKAKFAFSVDDNIAVSLGNIELPQGEIHSDEFFGEQEVLRHEIDVDIPVFSPAGETEFILRIGFQGCADAGLCYPPITKNFNILLPGDGALSGIGSLSISTAPGMQDLSEQDRLAVLIREGNLVWVVLAFLGFGLALTFTPCVLPMVPILSSIIAGQKDITTGRAFYLSLVYVLAMALTYTAAGVLAALFGQNLQALFQNPWILSTFAGIFVLLSLSMFGFYELQIPIFIQDRVTAFSNKQQGGSTPGVAVMGVLSALIVGPCVAAPLAGALIVIGQTGDPLRGGVALFTLAMGMGIPLLIVGTGAGHLLPKAGGWMNAVKAAFGVILLAVAIYLLERILPGVITMLLWAGLLIVSAVYLGVGRSLAADASGWRVFWKGVGVIAMAWGLVILIGAAGGRTDPLEPLRGFGSGAAAEAERVSFRRIKSSADLDQVLQQAGTVGQSVLLDFYSDWCVSCKEMEKYSFPDPEVRKALRNTLLVQADVTANDDVDQALMTRFGIYGPPSIILFNAQGEELKAFRIVGYKPADQFAAHLNRAFKQN